MQISFKIVQNSSTAFWIQVKDQIGNYISSNNIPSGTRLPCVSELAKQAGVSLKTSERALIELVKEGICFRRPKKGTFVNDGISVPQSSTRICGLCYNPGLESLNCDMLQLQVVQGIRSASHGICDTVFFNDDPETCIRRYVKAGNMELCGVVMLHWLDQSEVIRIAERFPAINFVFINYFLKGFEGTPENVYGIFNDDFGGGYQMAGYLLERGHRNFGIISLDQENRNYDRRIEGFCARVKNEGLEIPRENIISAARMEKHYSFDDLVGMGKKLAVPLMKRGISAIFATNDHLAEGALAAVGKRKTEVVGYDAFMPLRRHMKCTAMAIDFEKMGSLAVALLTNKSSNFPKITVVNPQLLVKN